MKYHLKQIEDSYARFRDSIVTTQTLQGELEKSLMAYKAAIEELVQTISATENMLDAVLDTIDRSGKHAQLLNATKQMQETQMSFNLQYLQLQSQMQHESRTYTAISNIMKTKHDTVKNSISNVR